MRIAMGFQDDFKQKVIDALNAKFGGNVNQMAKNMGVQQASLARYLDGLQDTLSMKQVEKALAYLGGTLYFSEVTSQDYCFVQLCDARPAAGGCSLETSGNVEKTLAFRHDWLASKTTTSPSGLCAMRIKGDSMHPTIEDADTILIDTGSAGRELIDGKIYVIRRNDSIYVKRFRQGVDKLVFLGDNREMDYQDITVQGLASETDGFAVIGRVLWSGREH